MDLNELHYVDFVLDKDRTENRPMAFSVLFSVVHSFNSDQADVDYRVGIDLPHWEPGTLTKPEFQSLIRVMGSSAGLAKFMQRTSIQRLNGLLTEIPVVKPVAPELSGIEQAEYVGLCRNRAAEKRAKERLPFAQWNTIYKYVNDELVETEGPGAMLVTMSSKANLQKYPLFLGKRKIDNPEKELKFTVYGALESGGLPSFGHREKNWGKNSFWGFGSSAKRFAHQG